MMSPARVEDLASIVCMCKPVLALRNLEVDPVQTVGPLLCRHRFFPIDAPLPTVDLLSPSLAQNRQYRVTVTCLPTLTGQGNVKDAKVRILCTRSGSIVVLLTLARMFAPICSSQARSVAVVCLCLIEDTYVYETKRKHDFQKSKCNPIKTT